MQQPHFFFFQTVSYPIMTNMWLSQVPWEAGTRDLGRGSERGGARWRSGSQALCGGGAEAQLGPSPGTLAAQCPDFTFLPVSVMCLLGSPDT